MVRLLISLSILFISCSTSPPYVPPPPPYVPPTSIPLSKAAFTPRPITAHTPTPLATFDVSALDNPATLMSTAMAVLAEPLDNTPSRMLAPTEAMLRKERPNAKILCDSSIKYEIEVVYCEVLTDDEIRVLISQHDISVRNPELLEPQQIAAIGFWPYEGQYTYGDLQTCPPRAECVYDYGVSTMELSLITVVIKAKWVSELAQWK